MKNGIFKYPSIVLFILFSGSSASKTGDFSPLHLGDYWKYKGTDTALALSSSLNHNFVRTIEVQSEIKKVDTTNYTILITDSNFNDAQNPDTVIKFIIDVKSFLDSTIKLTSNDSMLLQAFETHFYSDSLLNIENISGMQLAVFNKIQKIGTSPPSFGFEVKKVQNIGLTNYVSTNTGYRYWRIIKYNLFEHNNKTYLTINKNKSIKARSFNTRSLFGLRFDFLGRKFK